MTSSKNNNFLSANKYNQIIFWFAVLFSIINIIFITNSALIDVGREGYSRWIFYYHVPIAWNASIAFLLGGINSFLYLRKKEKIYDDRALAFSELGALFGFLVLFSGFIWAEPAWQTNWRWEPRLTTTLILELIYLGYFMVKAYGGNYEKTSIYRSYISIMSLISFIAFIKRSKVSLVSDSVGSIIIASITLLGKILTPDFSICSVSFFLTSISKPLKR